MSTRKHIAIIGGGFSGTMTAAHILRNSTAPVKITICEMRKELGKGLAYSTPVDQHLLNVPAAGMSAYPDEPEHFLRYARSHDASITPTTFVPRHIFGLYVSAQLQEAKASASAEKVTLEHLTEKVVEITKAKDHYSISLENGDKLDADIVVLAVGNLAGKRPNWSKGLSLDDPRYLHDPWKPGAMASVKRTEDVLLVGTGLTAVDKIIELLESGHKGKIYGLSRHGLLPCAHYAPLVGKSDKTDVKEGSVLEELRHIRQQVAITAGSAQSESWRLVFDGSRSFTQKWWQSLSTDEKRRFFRHLRAYYEVHRHRMAPTIAEIIQKCLKSKQLSIFAARMSSIQEEGGRLLVHTKERGTGMDMPLVVDRIINCTGPQAGIESTENGLLRSLVESGIASKDSLKTGLAMKNSGQLVAEDGSLVPGLFAVGPLMQGQLLESIAVPELRAQAHALAQNICKLLVEEVSVK